MRNQRELAAISMTNGVDREWGEELCMIIVEPDPRFERVRQSGRIVEPSYRLGCSDGPVTCPRCSYRSELRSIRHSYPLTPAGSV